MSFFVFFCHIMKNIHQDDVDDNKVIKNKKIKKKYLKLISPANYKKGKDARRYFSHAKIEYVYIYVHNYVI